MVEAQENEARVAAPHLPILTAALVMLACTLIGVGGSFAGYVLAKATYRAEAYVVVYEMPPQDRELIGPDAANQVEAIYSQGALQPSVMQQILQRLPYLTETTVRQTVSISVVAYTPLTRVAAVADSPDNAATLANTVSEYWTKAAAATYNAAFDQASSSLQGQIDQISAQIQKLNTQLLQLSTPTATTTPNPTVVASLEGQLKTLTTTQSSLDQQLANLAVARAQVVGDSYIATHAEPNAATRQPDRTKTLLAGAAIGAAIGALMVLYLFRRRLQRAAKTTQSTMLASATIRGERKA
jgi:uncharacterized protein involved in exopolysaccharide biosynthesis